MGRQNEEQKKGDEEEQNEELTNEQVEEIYKILDKDYGISAILPDEYEFKQKIREVRGNLEILKKYIEEEII